jgi:N6-adenosine-specific RNA methylase IME4
MATAIKIMKKWGYYYKSNIVWVKADEMEVFK